MTKQRLLLAAAPLVIALAGCSGGLGDGVKLESIDIRTGNGALDAQGNATGDNLTIGRCVPLALSFLARFSDGEEQFFTDRAKWTSSDNDVIAIINSRATDDNLNRQFPLAIAPSNGASVQLTANFAGVTDTVNVTVVDSELVIEPSSRTFAVGVDTPLSARQVVGNTQTIPRVGSSINWTSSAPDPIKIGSPDSEDPDLGDGVMSASEAGSATMTAEMNLSIGGVDISEFFLEGGSQLGDVCQYSATAQVEAKVPTAYEVVPTFVSANSTNQSGTNSLFLASGTSTNVDVQAVFDNEQRQTVTGVVSWQYTAADQVTDDANNSDTDSSNDTPLLLLPTFGSGLISAGLDDHEINNGTGNAQLVASVRLGVIDSSENGHDNDPANDLDDAEVTLDVMIEDYANNDIELVLKPTTDSRVAFGSRSTYQVLGLFGGPDRMAESAELVLDLTASNLRYTGETTPDNDDVTEIFAPPTNELGVSLGFVGLLDIPAKPDADSTATPADSQTLQFELTGEILDGETDFSQRAESNEITIRQGAADLDELEIDDTLAITLEGETTPAADNLCVEVGDILDLDARVLFADESGDSVLSALVSESAVWSVTAGDQAITIRNDANLRGRVNVISNSPNAASLKAIYVNDSGDEVSADPRVERMDTLELMIMPRGDC